MLVGTFSILFFTLSGHCLRFIHVGYGYREIIMHNWPVCTFISISRFVSVKILKIKQTNDGSLCPLAYYLTECMHYDLANVMA